MTVPLYLAPEESTLADMDKTAGEVPVYYILTADGVKKRLRNPFYSVLVEADDELEGLAELEDGLILKTLPMPRLMVDEIVSFFAEICRRHTAEAAAILYYSDKMGWCWDVPRQETIESGLSVKYDPSSIPRKPGYRIFGSAHSHAKASAFQSGTDHGDECEFDGVHITVGGLPDNPTLDVRLMVCGQKWDIDEKCLIEAPPMTAKFPPEYLARVVPVKSFLFRDADADAKEPKLFDQFGTATWDRGRDKRGEWGDDDFFGAVGGG